MFYVDDDERKLVEYLRKLAAEARIEGESDEDLKFVVMEYLEFLLDEAMK